MGDLGSFVSYHTEIALKIDINHFYQWLNCVL